MCSLLHIHGTNRNNRGQRRVSSKISSVAATIVVRSVHTRVSKGQFQQSFLRLSSSQQMFVSCVIFRNTSWVIDIGFTEAEKASEESDVSLTKLSVREPYTIDFPHACRHISTSMQVQNASDRLQCKLDDSSSSANFRPRTHLPTAPRSSTEQSWQRQRSI